MGKKFLFAWFFMVLAVIVLYCQFSYQQQLRLDLNREANSLHVLALIYDLENRLLTADSAAAGYVAGAQEQQLKQYQASLEQINRLSAELGRTASKSPRQQQLLRLLQILIHGRVILLDRQVRMRQNLRVDVTDQPAQSYKDGQLPDRLRQVLVSLEDEEKKRLHPNWSQQIASAHTWVLAWTIVVLVSLSVLFLIAYLFAQEERRLRENEARLRNYQEDLRNLASQLSLAEERERRRIAAILHDHIGQSLALANIKLGELLLASNPPICSRQDRLLEVRRLLEDAIYETQSLTFTISSGKCSCRI